MKKNQKHKSRKTLLVANAALTTGWIFIWFGVLLSIVYLEASVQLKLATYGAYFIFLSMFFHHIGGERLYISPKNFMF